MPRKSRKAAAPSGGAMPNRTDLSMPTQPVAVPTGQAYGQAQRLEEAQQALPLGADATAAVVEDPLRVGIERAREYVPPNMGLAGPSTRPGEPVTAGVPIGPGPGTAPPLLVPQTRRVADTLRDLALATGDTTLANIAADFD